MMQFASFQEFLLMDGHGPYVWLAVFVPCGAGCFGYQSS